MDSRERLQCIRMAGKGGHFTEYLSSAGYDCLTATTPNTLQVNIIRACNLKCAHCHVESGPDRIECMTDRVLDQCLKIASLPEIASVDITGGAPELNPMLGGFLERVSLLGKRVIVRSNLAILDELEYCDMVDKYAKNRVELVASLTLPEPDRTDRQRGAGTFDKIIRVLQRLNGAGYGDSQSGLLLFLMHNPAGAYLAGNQKELELVYRRKLEEGYGVRFTGLFCLNNLPVGRFFEYLVKSGNLEEYMEGMKSAFNPAAICNLMCRSMISVGWDGRLYDCDFNQMLGKGIDSQKSSSIWTFDIQNLQGRRIVVDDHCFACTAGKGSSCCGEIV